MARKKKSPITKHFEFYATLFDVGCTPKEQAIKMLEESAETFGAVQDYEGLGNDDVRSIQAKWSILDEIADVLQATLNLAYELGFDEYDIEEAMDKVTKKNRERGRF